MWRFGRALRVLAGSTVLASCLAMPALAQDNPFAKINHIVVIYTENRSFDNLFSEFPQADGLRPGASIAPQVDTDGSVLKELPRALAAKGKVDGRFPGSLANAPFLIDDYLPQGEKTGDLVHKFYQEQIDGGKNDRFAAVSDVGGLAMGYYDGSGHLRRRSQDRPRRLQ